MQQDLRLLHALLLTFPGSPCIYYGDEIGLTGGADPGCRKCMIWEETEQNLELLVAIKRLISLRKQEPLLANDGQFEFIQKVNNKHIVAYRTFNEDKSIVILINPTDQEQAFTLPCEGRNLTITHLITDKTYDKDDSETHIIAPYDYQILLIKKSR